MDIWNNIYPHFAQTLLAQYPENRRPCVVFLTWLKLLPLALCVNKFTHTRLLAIFNGSSIENYYSTRLFIAKGNSPPRAEGQRWEAQRAAEQCLETGGMMFERSEFLPPQALRQAASGEVWTDRKMSQSDSWAKEAPNAVHDCPCFWYFFPKSTDRKSWRKIKVNN